MGGYKTIAGTLLLLGLAGCAGKPPAPPEPGVVPKVERLPKAAPRVEDKAVSVPLDADDNIFFKSGEVELDAEDMQKLQRHAQRLKDDPKLLVTLVGHADDQGSRSYQLARAEQRLEAVFQALRRMGVAVRQLKRYPVGREKGNPGCNAPECRVGMRRVELIYRQ